MHYSHRTTFNNEQNRHRIVNYERFVMTKCEKKLHMTTLNVLGWAICALKHYIFWLSNILESSGPDHGYRDICVSSTRKLRKKVSNQISVKNCKKTLAH